MLASAAAPAWAWSPATRVRMVDDAVLLMPPGLRVALERHRADVRRGALEPMSGEDGPSHRPSWAGGTLDAEIARSAAGLAVAVEQLASFRTIARRFGELAHFVADAGFPPIAGGRCGPARFRHFAVFCETRRERFPLVFYGYEDADLDREDFAGFARRILEAARSEDLLLERAYRQAGDPPDPAAFDDRSVPFAVASLSYSRTVTDIARAWRAAWSSAGGDLTGTPYRGARRGGRR